MRIFINNSSGIYQIKNNINNKIYIGSAINLRKRKNSHFFDLKHKKHKNSHLQSSYNKYGKEFFVFEVLMFCHPSLLLWYEQQFIDQWKPEYNKNPNAMSRIGTKHSEESKQKMREKHIGIKFSEETKRKISENSRNISNETREKLSLARKNRIVSDKTRKKISESNKGKKGMVGKNNPNYGKSMPENIRIKISQSKKGKKQTPEVIKKRSEAIKKSWDRRKEGVK